MITKRNGFEISIDLGSGPERYKTKRPLSDREMVEAIDELWDILEEIQEECGAEFCEDCGYHHS